VPEAAAYASLYISGFSRPLNWTTLTPLALWYDSHLQSVNVASNALPIVVVLKGAFSTPSLTLETWLFPGTAGAADVSVGDPFVGVVAVVAVIAVVAVVAAALLPIL
jgi:hypothetical protein